MFKHILVPLDGSRFSGQALRYAIVVAQRFGAEVILMQVVSPASLTVVAAPPVGEASPVVIEMAVQGARRQDKKNEARAKRYLRKKLQGVAAKGIKGSHHVVMGIPARSIMEFCHKEAVDLIVMATHGRSGLRRAFVGSVADEVIRESGVPVLVTRPQRRGKK